MGADSFEIVVKGTLGPAFLEAFDGFVVTDTENGRTHLEGGVPDQARLHGALTMLRDLGIELVSVTRVDTQPDGKPVARTKEK